MTALSPREHHGLTEEYDRSAEDIGNIVGLRHVNTAIPGQRLSTLFYVTGLGLTRDPFINTSTDNMWINVGQSQFHLPTGRIEVLRGITGLVLPDRAALLERLARCASRSRALNSISANAMIASRPSRRGAIASIACARRDRFGPVALGMAYVNSTSRPAPRRGSPASTARSWARAPISSMTARDGARAS